MSSDEESDEIEDQEKLEQKVDFTSSRQAKKEARLNQIIFENEHKAKIRKVCKHFALLCSYTYTFYSYNSK